MHERVDVPEPVTLAGVSVQLSPEAGEIVAVRLTAPLKPCTAVTVIVEVLAVPALAETDVGLAEIVKSCTLKVTTVEWEIPLLVPVTVTV